LTAAALRLASLYGGQVDLPADCQRASAILSSGDPDGRRRSDVSNGMAEGFDNVVGTIKKQAYGIHDRDYLKLKSYGSAGSLSRRSSWRWIFDGRGSHLQKTQISAVGVTDPGAFLYVRYKGL
jgi:hypothetical protein